MSEPAAQRRADSIGWGPTVRRAFLLWRAGWSVWARLGAAAALASLTVALAGPAALGLAAAAHPAVRGDPQPRLADLAREAGRHAGAGLAWLALNAAVAGFTALNWPGYAGLPSGTRWATMAVHGLALALWICVSAYALPFYAAQRRKSLALALRNGLLATLRGPVFTLVWVSLALAVWAISIVTVAPLFLGGPSLAALLAASAVEDRLRRYGVREEDGGNAE